MTATGRSLDVEQRIAVTAHLIELPSGQRQSVGDLSKASLDHVIQSATRGVDTSGTSEGPSINRRNLAVAVAERVRRENNVSQLEKGTLERVDREAAEAHEVLSDSATAQRLPDFKKQEYVGALARKAVVAGQLFSEYARITIKAYGRQVAAYLKHAWDRAMAWFHGEVAPPLIKAKPESLAEGLTGSGFQWKMMKTVLADVFDGVLKSDLNHGTPTSVKMEDIPGAFGSYGPDGITIRPWDAEGIGSLVHEKGHVIDEQYLMSAADHQAHPDVRYASQLAAAEKGEGPLVPWFDAVTKSDAYGELKAMRSRAELRARSGKQKAIKILKDLEYYLKPQEVFARSLVQYVANRTSNRMMKRQWESFLRENTLGQGVHWTDHDFKDIDAALDEVFRSKGMVP